MPSTLTSTSISQQQSAQVNAGTSTTGSQLIYSIRPYTLPPTTPLSVWDLVPTSAVAFGTAGGAATIGAVAYGLGAYFDNQHNADVEQQVEDEGEDEFETMYH